MLICIQEMGQAQEETSTRKNNKFDYDVTTNEETRFAAIASRYGVMILAGLWRERKTENSIIVLFSGAEMERRTRVS